MTFAKEWDCETQAICVTLFADSTSKLLPKCSSPRSEEYDAKLSLCKELKNLVSYPYSYYGSYYTSSPMYSQQPSYLQQLTYPQQQLYPPSQSYYQQQAYGQLPMYPEQQVYPMSYYGYPGSSMTGYSMMNGYGPGYYGGVPYKPSTLRTIYNKIRHGNTYANVYNQSHSQDMYDYGRYRGWPDYGQY
ncbi:hypothetical protein BY458DRAFT_490399 [Sporodiniella umbellata]|nr:hypothetical protein BY458DRAFT_490399 [Sporodiniella umbellata]